MNQNNFQHIDTADGTRGIACIIVLLTHAIILSFPNTYKYLVGIPKFGVWLFFVLSSFLLTNKFITTGFNKTSIISYTTGRFLKIIPLYVTAVLLYTKCQIGGLANWSNAKEAILLKSSYAHFWTIPVEFKFYAFLPVIAFIFTKLSKKISGLSFFAILATSIVIHQIIWPYYNTPIGSSELAWYLPCFLIGSYLAADFHRLQDTVKKLRTNIIPGVIIIIFALSAPISQNLLFNSPFETTLTNKFIFVSIAWSIFILTTASSNNIYSKALKNKLITNIGKQSYSIYLFHIIIFVTIFEKFPKNIFAMIAAISIALLIGKLSYQSLEIPIENIRRKINKNSQKLSKPATN